MNAGEVLGVWGVSLLVSFGIALVGGGMFRKDWLKVMFWGALFSPVGALVALMLLKEEEIPEDETVPVVRKKRRSKAQQRKLDEAARKMGM